MSSGMMALAQPNPAPYHHSQPETAKPPRISRRASMEEYQRRIVEKIKRHFDRRRKQWESNLQKQAEVFNVCASKDQGVELPYDEQKVSGAKDTDAVVATTVSPLRCDGVIGDSTEMASLKVVCSRCIKQNRDKVSRWKFEVDINDFLPDGEVLISTEGKTLTATGHVAKRKSRGGGTAGSGSSLAMKVQLMLDGEVDSRSMRVTTATTGIMTIEVSVTHDTDSSR